MILAFDVEGAPTGFARRFFTEALARELLLRPIGNTVLHHAALYPQRRRNRLPGASQTPAALEASLD